MRVINAKRGTNVEVEKPAKKTKKKDVTVSSRTIDPDKLQTPKTKG